jgi:hypothetical protein
VSLWTKIQKNQKYAFILYKTKNKENSGNNKYVVALDFRFVYEMDLDECSTTFLCREMNSYIKLPKSTPDNRLTGKFSDLSEGKYTEDKNLIKFEKSPKLLGLFGSSLEINLEMVELDNIHSLYELKGEKNIEISNGNEVGEYCSAEVSVSNGDYIFKCDHPDGLVTFRFELTKFGTLPDWVEERVNINTLINHLDRDESIIVEVRDAKESTESKWISELQDKEIIGVR